MMILGFLGLGLVAYHKKRPDHYIGTVEKLRGIELVAAV
jgi:hypothetical protein